MTTTRDELRKLAAEHRAMDHEPTADAIDGLLDALDQAEARIRDLTQEAKDERGAALDLIEQVKIRDARIKAVQDVLDEPDAMIGTRLHVSVDRIRRALEA